MIPLTGAIESHIAGFGGLSQGTRPGSENFSNAGHYVDPDSTLETCSNSTLHDNRTTNGIRSQPSERRQLPV